MQLRALRKGDIVDVIAPASRCSREDFNNAIRELQRIGLTPRVPKGLFARSVLFSNSDEKRWQHLRSALLADDSKMIWCVRGGYGSLRLLPRLELLKRPRTAKIFLGYSDITTLHSFLNQKWKWPTFHGPMLDRFGRETTPRIQKNQLLDLLFGREGQVEFSKLKPMNVPAHRKGKISAAVVGGNMAVLQSAMGTRWQLNPKGKILFLEDIGERPHRVDRMLTQFAHAGYFESAQAVVFGHFQLADTKDRRQLWTDVMARFAAEQKIPVLKGLPVGHDPNIQLTLPFLTPAELSLGTNANLKVASGIRGSITEPANHHQY